MSACARGCCWTPFSCGKSRECLCHSTEIARKAERDALKTASRITYRDPVPGQAINNIEHTQGRRK